MVEWLLPAWMIFLGVIALVAVFLNRRAQTASKPHTEAKQGETEEQ